MINVIYSSHSVQIKFDEIIDRFYSQWKRQNLTLVRSISEEIIYIVNQLLHNSNSPILSINSYPLVPSQNNLSRTPCTRIKKKKKDLLTHLSSNSHSSIQTTDPNNHTDKLKPPSTRNTCPHFTHPPHTILHPPPPSRALRLSIKKISSRRNKYLSDWYLLSSSLLFFPQSVTY